MKIVSIWIVGFIIIRNPYAQIGIEISNNIVTTVTIANTSGEIYFLIVENENNIYIAIKITHTIKATIAAFCI
jgi:hypothetical protein